MKLMPCSCPLCGKLTIALTDEGDGRVAIKPNRMLHPIGCERIVPTQVTDEAPQIARDFNEASAVFGISHQASAALARRCLQAILVAKTGTKKKDLSEQIEETLQSLPHELALNVDAIRNVGNFAAHPIKSKSTGEIVAVEEGEAEWLLNVLEELFQFFYVEPAKAKERRNALNAKLKAAGKPPLKEPEAR